MNILLTGATGFLGQYLVKYFSKHFSTVYVLTRKETDLSESQFSHYGNVILLKGDITHFDVLIIDENKRSKILSQIDIVVHAAALYDLKASYSDCFLQNVVGTQNVLHLLKSMSRLKAFYAISTIAVGDPTTYFLDENTLPARSIFEDSYSATKYQAEQLIRENLSKKFVTRIIRPGIIIGDSSGSKMPKTDGPYYFLEAIKKHIGLIKKLPFIPLSFNPKAKIPLIPVDHCARFIDLLISRDKFENQLKTYHLISNELPNLKEFLADVKIEFGLKAEFIPFKKNKVHDSILKIAGIPKEVLPFMFSKLSYDKSSTLEDLPEIEESTYSDFKKILFQKIL